MNRIKSLARVIPFFLLSIIQYSSRAQSLSGLQLFDEAARSKQIDGQSDSLLSFCVRPIFNNARLIFDSPPRQTLAGVGRLNPGSGEINLMPVVFLQQYNSHHPYGWNDGSMIPAKGYQNQISFGIYAKKGIFSLQLRPEIVYAQNRDFATFPAQQSDSIWNIYYNSVLNRIDAPEKFGTGHYLKMFPGQSSFRISYHKIGLGLSTENLWWGPGIRNSLLMSNSAPGFPHLSFNSVQPVRSPIGSFEWQVISGKVKGSGIIPDDTTRTFNGQQLYIPKQSSDRYLNGMVFAWHPKWTNGLFVGFSRMFYEYVSDRPSTLDGYLPVVGKFFKKGLSDEDAKRRDQLISFFFRLVLSKERAEVYGELGRNDHSENLRDFLLEPEHSRAYILGFSKSFERNGKTTQFFSEITNLQLPSTILLRAQSSWYSHYQVRHGYTNYGQLIGAGIGPGGASQTLGLQWGTGLQKTGGTIERVVNNNDFYYQAFTSYQDWHHHWVDLSLNLNKSWLCNRMVYDFRLSLIRSLNYQWYRNDVTQISARVSLAYLF